MRRVIRIEKQSAIHPRIQFLMILLSIVTIKTTTTSYIGQERLVTAIMKLFSKNLLKRNM